MTEHGQRSAKPAARDGVLSVVVPVFNEEDLIDELIERIVAACQRTAMSFELVVVNDGSRDGTLSRAIETSRRLPRLRVINLQRNFGHMAAIGAGLAAAKGDAIVVIDGDLQDPPELIPEFVTHWKEGADVVYGLRTRRHEPLNRRVLARIFYAILSRFSDTPIPKSVGTYGLLDRTVLATLGGLQERSRFFAGLRAWTGGRQVSVAYDRPERPRGKSRVGYAGKFALAITAITSFSKTPLRVASLLSLVVGFGLFMVGIIALILKLFTDRATPGWATFAVLIGVMGFVQSAVLAVLAEYVGVIFDEVKARPAFLVREEFAKGERVREGDGSKA